jgi:hypothetical protein
VRIPGDAAAPVHTSPLGGEVSFAAGSAVTVTRDESAALSPSVVPVDCPMAFTDLGLTQGAVLFVSSYLSAGAPIYCLAIVT